MDDYYVVIYLNNIECDITETMTLNNAIRCKMKLENKSIPIRNKGIKDTVLNRFVQMYHIDNERNIKVKGIILDQQEKG